MFDLEFSKKDYNLILNHISVHFPPMLILLKFNGLYIEFISYRISCEIWLLQIHYLSLLNFLIIIINLNTLSNLLASYPLYK